MENKEIIRICTNHKKQVPLIFTQAFVDKKYWCPHCGMTYEELSDDNKTELTDTLKKRRSENLEKTQEFLNASVILNSDKKIDFGGIRIDKKDLPEAKISQLKEIVNSYKYEGKKGK